jgi:hypothetical protein
MQVLLSDFIAPTAAMSPLFPNNMQAEKSDALNVMTLSSSRRLKKPALSIRIMI